MGNRGICSARWPAMRRSPLADSTAGRLSESRFAGRAADRRARQGRPGAGTFARLPAPLDGHHARGFRIRWARPGGSEARHSRLRPYADFSLPIPRLNLPSSTAGSRPRPEMHQAECFVRDDFALKPFRSETWGGFVFVNIDGQAPPLANGLDGMAADLAGFRTDEMQVVVAREWECEFNWKVLVENFMESYLLTFGIHHKTLQPDDAGARHVDRRCGAPPLRAFSSALQRFGSYDEYRAFEQRGDFADDLPPVPGIGEMQKSEWGLFLIHPTFLLATPPDRAIIWWIASSRSARTASKLLTTTLFPFGCRRAGKFCPAARQVRPVAGGVSPRGHGSMHRRAARPVCERLAAGPAQSSRNARVAFPPLSRRAHPRRLAHRRRPRRAEPAALRTSNTQVRASEHAAANE